MNQVVTDSGSEVGLSELELDRGRQLIEADHGLLLEAQPIRFRNADHSFGTRQAPERCFYE